MEIQDAVTMAQLGTENSAAGNDDNNDGEDDDEGKVEEDLVETRMEGSSEHIFVKVPIMAMENPVDPARKYLCTVSMIWYSVWVRYHPPNEGLHWVSNQRH